jgi:phage shock protein C
VDEGTEEMREGPEEERHLLRRSRDDRILTGVCGGLARYFGIDPTVVRLAFVLLAVAGGGGILLYVAALILMPEEQPGERVGGPATDQKRGEALWFFVGAALVGLGFVLLIGQLVPLVARFLGPAVLIALGIWILVAVTQR